MLIAPFRAVTPAPAQLVSFSGRKKPESTGKGDRFEQRLPRVPFAYQQDAMPQILNGKEVRLNTTAYITHASPDDTSAETAVPFRAVQMFGDNDLSQIGEAAQAGYASFSKTTFTQRAAILDKLAALLTENRDEMSRLIALEVAKPIVKAEAETDRSIQLLKYYADKCRELETKSKDRRDMGNGHGVYQTLKPLGPVLAYTPFNFPLNLVMHKLAPAIGAGTSIVIKPSPRCPLTSLFLGKLCVAAGYKAVSVVNLSNEQSKALVQDPKFKIFSFTGGPGVGYMLAEASKAEKNVLELGNNSPLIIEDVKNQTELKNIARRAAQFKFSFAGQTCISVQRIFVNEKLYPTFVKAFAEEMDRLKVGNVLERDTVMGPMVDKAAADRIQSWVADALSKGAKLLGEDQDANRITRPGWFKPTALIDTTPDMDVNRQEVFAPVVTITPYKGFKNGIALANDSDFALHAGLYTQSQNKVDYARRVMDVTGLNVNEVPTYRDDRLPYGGAKQSGIGAEGSDVGIEDYSRIVYTDHNET